MKHKSTKSALLMSFTSLLLCFAMLIGCTFAWFTDTATANVCKIQSGKLDVDLVDAGGNSVVGSDLQFKKAAGAPSTEAVLWEPGCTYELPAVKVKNNGNLALKYTIQITGVTGSAKLLEAIEFTTASGSMTGTLLPGATSDPITIKGHMKEDAGNEYQGLTLDGIAITVYATQMEHEFDSYNNNYDANADGSPDTPAANNLVPSFEVAKKIPATKPATVDDVTLKNNDDSFSVEIPSTVVEAVYDDDAFKAAVQDAGTDPSVELNLNVAPTTTTDANIVTEGQAAQAYEVELVAVVTPATGTATEIPIENTTTPLTVKMKVGTGLNITAIKHVKNESTTITYTPGTGSLRFNEDTDPKYTFNYTDDVVTFLTDSFSPVYVVYDVPAARIVDKNYNSLAEAVADAQAGATITLLRDCSGDGIQVKKSLNIDLNGKTYTIGGALKGSSATETNGFQIFKGNTVKIENGKIDTATTVTGDPANECRLLLQNYADLTLNNVTLDGSALTDNREGREPYVVSNNCGTVNITGNTSITAPAGGYAFDAYYWPAGGYSEGVIVNINTTGTISGKIELDADKTATTPYGNVVNITNGNFVGSFVVTKGNLSITGGTFSSNPSEYVAPGYKAIKTGDVWTVSDGIAQIGTTKYPSLEKAIEAAKTGDTIKMLCDTEYTEPNFVLNGVNLDLNNHTIKVSRKAATSPKSFVLAGNVTVSNGNFVGDMSSQGRGIIYADEGCYATLNNVNVTSKCGDKPAYGVANYNGNYMQNPNGSMVINGGTFDCLVGTNGSTRNGSLTINGGTFNEVVYFPATMTYTINGGVFNDIVEFRSGDINISGGEFKATGVPNAEFNAKKDNVDVTGCSISLVNHNGTMEKEGYGPCPELNITGGTFVGDIGLCRMDAGNAYPSVTIAPGIDVKKVELGLSEAN